MRDFASEICIQPLNTALVDENIEYDYDLYWFSPSSSPYVVSPTDFERLRLFEVRRPRRHYVIENVAEG